MLSIRTLLLAVASGALLVLATTSPGGPPPNETAFTYQARLNFEGEPVDGVVDMMFRLFDEQGERAEQSEYRAGKCFVLKVSDDHQSFGAEPSGEFDRGQTAGRDDDRLFDSSGGKYAHVQALEPRCGIRIPGDRDDVIRSAEMRDEMLPNGKREGIGLSVHRGLFWLSQSRLARKSYRQATVYSMRI